MLSGPPASFGGHVFERSLIEMAYMPGGGGVIAVRVFVLASKDEEASIEELWRGAGASSAATTGCAGSVLRQAASVTSRSRR
jgi:hypothetical protein